MLEVTGAIGPATSRYVVHGIETAEANDSRLVILQIDTPGGLDTSMRDIIRAILASSIPVVGYVAPPGARAASAGTYILYATHVAAMAPATNLGAATPVSIGGESAPSPEPEHRPEATDHDKESSSGKDSTAGKESGSAKESSSGKDSTTGKELGSGKESGSAKGSTSGKKPTDGGSKAEDRKGSQPEDRSGSKPESQSDHPVEPVPSSAMERKVINDAVAYIRGLAELRGRNADWAEQAVRGAASLSATAALRQKVVDIVARDVPDLLDQLDGREIKVANRTQTLQTRALTVTYVKPDWRIRLLSVITHPTIAYGLLLIGIYGLLFEGYNPGAVFPGVVGAISLLIALFAFQLLSVNIAGLALVALGVGMIIAEFFFPAFGSLGLGGLVAFVVGSLILFDTDTPGMSIGRPLIAAVATVGGGVILAMAWLAGRSLRRPVVTGAQAMIGEPAEALEDFAGKGRVRYGGELWNARTEGAQVRSGQMVRIKRVDGLTLWVEPI
ncbi:MAG TPA: NfeD family protein [Steroidobacteraceae bacterium]|nr:NfeD family protein [Steroidobacteraceae bacterium]